ncbi:hypothetical protein RHMOL_Rhmol04G0325500 [Rhododendron molle]|uniref:Uncharacterized protein n=1 Tax=Rhododendron molle TaxID=49168 RepID=A0ACC0P7T9_RHOML|nr:hypothetical protein RHMOL_Rhmol04G0325500 [Rhododendron molle]
MGKAGNWIKNCWGGKKNKKKETSNRAYSFTDSEIFIRSPSDRTPPPETLKEKRVRSFGRSPPRVPTLRPADHAVLESWVEQKQAVAVAAATARLAGAAANRRGRAVEEAAAVMIQSAFRSYLARKALRALKGLVKVQALVRGYLVRRRTTATLRCMQSLATAQARARAQRMRMADESNSNYRTPSNHRKSLDMRSRPSSYNEIDWPIDESIRVVEMDVGESKRSTNSRRSFSGHPQTPQTNHRVSMRSVPNCAYSKQELRDLSLKPSALVDVSSPRARSMRFDDYYFDTAQSSSRHSSPRYSFSSAASMSDHPSHAQTHHRAVQSRAYSKQERQDLSLLQPPALVDSSPRAESGRFVDYYLDTAQSSPRASSTTSKPEYPSYDYNMMAPAYMENTEPSKAKLVRSRSGRENTEPSKAKLERSGSGREDTEPSKAKLERSRSGRENTEPSKPKAKLERSRSAPRMGADSIAGMSSRKKAPQAGTRPDSNADPWLAKLARASASGKERDHGSSGTGHTNTVYGRSRSE